MQSRTAEGSCWLWPGPVDGDGYGRIWNQGKKHSVHRFVYESVQGPVPPGLVLDHVCHNQDLTCRGGDGCRHRACVNPEHLEPVTQVENVGRRKYRLATCRWGHRFDEANTYVNPQGYRECRACIRHRAAAYKVRRQLRAAGVPQ